MKPLVAESTNLDIQTGGLHKQADMYHKVFYDEVRSWRCPAAYIAFIGSTVLASVGTWILAHAITDDGASRVERILIGGVFGAGFALLFSIAAVVMFLRLLRSPCRVRLTDSGIVIGQASISWPQVHLVCFKVAKSQAWLSLKTVPPDSRRFLVPGLALPPATWSRLADQLRGHFKQSGLKVKVEILMVRGI